MIKYLFIISLIILYSCKNERAAPPSHQLPISQKIKDNDEMFTLFKNDQDDRKSNTINWDILTVKDSLRESNVLKLLKNNMLHTSKDFERAAMVFQHGPDSISSKMAIKMMKKAIAIDSLINKWLLAAAIDRHLMKKREPQIYGTQYRKTGPNNTWELYKLDSFIISDQERINHNVPTLKEQKAKLQELNEE